MFAALALSPTCTSAFATGHPTSVPILHFSPPTPPSRNTTFDTYAGTLTDALPSPFYSNSSSGSSGSPVAISPDASVQEVPEGEIESGPVHRPLASNEAKQLSLLLMQHLFPVRNNLKGITRESIVLADQLHEAGVRWDKHRRVMGMHLRGIWEEGQRLGGVRAVAGHGAMELYIQGSFLSIAEQPHPLDPMPIPILVNPASFATLPKLTLQAGLANSLPGAPGYMAPLEQHYMRGMESVPWHPAQYAWDDAGVAGDEGDDGGHGRIVRGNDSLGPLRRKLTGGRRSWRDRKAAGLKIQVHAPAKRGLRAMANTPRTAASILSSRRSTFATGVLPRKSSKWFFGLCKSTVAPVAVPATARSARRVSFGGYEVR